MSQKYSCIVVDDEEPGRDLIAAHLAHLPQFELIRSCSDAIEASEVLSTRPVDLMFLDIEMPAMRGTDFYHSLTNPPPVIFITAYRDYAVRGFELEAVDYLLKPVVFPRFFKATQRFLALSNGNQRAEPSRETLSHPDDLFLRIDRKDMRLRRDDILYVRSMGDYQQIYTTGKRYMHKATMNSVAQKLGPSFVRIHRSYLVNQRHINAITRDDVIVGEFELPISDGYRDVALSVLGAVEPGN